MSAGISLVVATVGRATELGRLFDSLCAQCSREFELIVVDQNGDDRLVSIIDTARQSGLEVEHLRLSQRNLSLARNMGAAAAGRSIIAFPDDDCWYEAEVVQHVVEAFARDPHLDALVARWVEHPGAPARARVLSSAQMRRFREGPTSSICLFFRRATLVQAGDFDPNLGVGCWYGGGEEIDLLLRCLANGARIAYLPHIRVHHRFGACVSSFARVRRSARGTGALYAKHALPLPVVLRGLAAPLFRSVLRAHHPAKSALEIATALGRVEGLVGWGMSPR